MRIKRKRFVFNRMKLFYFKEKLTDLLRHEDKNIKKHVSVKNLIYKDIFAKVEVIKEFMKMKENGEKIYKMLNAWLRNCISILAFTKKEIKDTKRETGRKMLGE